MGSSSVDRQLGWVYFLAKLNTTGTNRGYKYLSRCVNSSLSICQVMIVLGHMIFLYLFFLGISILISISFALVFTHTRRK